MTEAKVPLDPDEGVALLNIVDQAHEDYWSAVDGGLDATVAKMKLDDAFDAYHRYLKLQK